MNDSYQAIYEAARSRIGRCDTASIVEIAAMNAFDGNQWQMHAIACFDGIGHEHQRPSSRLSIKMFRDGNQWCCALYWPEERDMRQQLVAFGDTPEKATQAFDKAWIGEQPERGE